MPLYPFGANDIFYNRIKTHPKSDFWIYNRKIYYNNKGVDAGSFHSQSLHVQPGFVSLYEMNVDRSQNVAGQMIYPFITKDSGISAFKTVSTNDFNSGYLYGEQIAGRYPLSASIAIEDRKDTTLGHDIRADLTSGRQHILALKNILNSYYYMSPDINRNGELIQVGGTANRLGSNYGSGSVAGVVLYNEGFVVLTGSWDISTHKDDYDGDTGVDDTPKWLYFGTSANLSPGGGPSFGGTTRGITAQESVTSSAWQLTFEGVNYVPVMTMFAHAPRGMLNHSNNPTFKQYGQAVYTQVANTSSYQYIEPDDVTIKNIVSSSWETLTASSNTVYAENSASFKKQTFISKVGIYDAEKNLIAVAKLAKPIRKTEEDDYTFKLKLDF